MKLATYNLNGIRARLPRLLEWLAREQPDIACLQELKCADESLPIADIEAAGYRAVWVDREEQEWPLPLPEAQLRATTLVEAVKLARA